MLWERAIIDVIEKVMILCDTNLHSHFDLQDLQKELEYNQARALTLHDIACHLPASQRTRSLDAAIAKLVTLKVRIATALKTVTTQKSRIETALNIKPSPSVRMINRVTISCR